MTIEQLTKLKIDAMKQKDIVAKAVLTSVIGNVKNAAIAEKCQDNISEAIVEKVLNKEKKTIKEQISTCPKDRVENLATFEQHLAYIQTLCPDKSSDVEALKAEIISMLNMFEDFNAKSFTRAVMQSKELRAKYDAGIINSTLKEVINQINSKGE